MDQTCTLAQKIKYPSLPPEIRNKVMEYALCPGDIYPPYTRCGVQLLATNRQNYQDGHVMFYSDNVFHVPCGKSIPDGEDCVEILKNYQSKHLNLIRRIKLTCSILDLNRDVLERPTMSWVRSLPGAADLELGAILRGLTRLWCHKVMAVPRIFPLLDEFNVEFSDYKPSQEWLKDNGMLHIQGQSWSGMTQICKLGRPTFLLKRQTQMTPHPMFDFDKLLKNTLDDESFAQLYKLLGAAMGEVFMIVETESRGGDRMVGFWDWLQKQKEEHENLLTG